LSLKFYRLVSLSVARAQYPNDQRPARRPRVFTASPKSSNGTGHEPAIAETSRPVTARTALSIVGPPSGCATFNQIARSITPSRRCRSQCSHSIVVDAAPWSDEVRLSDLEPRFTYNAAAPPVNAARAELLTIGILIAAEHGSIQALTEFHFRIGANR